MQGNPHVEYWQIILTNMHFFREQPLRLQRGRLSDWSITQRRLGFAEQVVQHFLNPQKKWNYTKKIGSFNLFQIQKFHKEIQKNHTEIKQRNYTKKIGSCPFGAVQGQGRYQK